MVMKTAGQKHGFGFNSASSKKGGERRSAAIQLSKKFSLFRNSFHGVYCYVEIYFILTRYIKGKIRSPS